MSGTTTDGTTSTTSTTSTTTTTSTATSTAATEAADRVAALRGRIDALDDDLVRLWRERAEISREIGAARVAAGGTRIALAREHTVLDRFRTALGADGVDLGLLLLRAGRGRL